MELIADAGHRAVELARTLGLAQEALRLECNVVASEHLLMATLCDPVVRREVKGLGVDMRDVQTLVQAASERRQTGSGSGSGSEAGFAITTTAAALLLDATGSITGLEPDTRPDPAVFSAAMIAVMVTLLRDPRDSTARSILLELGLGQAPSLLEALGNSATVTPSLPRRPSVDPTDPLPGEAAPPARD